MFKRLILAVVVCSTVIMAGEADSVVLTPKKAVLHDVNGDSATVAFQIEMIKKSLSESKGVSDVQIKQGLATIDQLESLNK